MFITQLIPLMALLLLMLLTCSDEGRASALGLSRKLTPNSRGAEKPAGSRVEARVLSSTELTSENIIGRVEALEGQLNAEGHSTLEDGPRSPDLQQSLPCSCFSKRGKVPAVFDSCDLQLVGGRSDSYGAWPMCYNHVPLHATVYSFGIGGDVSFDISIILQKGAKVSGFDPTVNGPAVHQLFLRSNGSEAWPSFSFMQIGIGISNGVVTFSSKDPELISSRSSLPSSSLKGYNYRGETVAVLTLSTFMRSLEHDYVDLLKMDVEGAEFELCQSEDFLKALESVGQLLVEFHERLLADAVGRLDACITAFAQKGFTAVYNRSHEEFVFARLKPNDAVILNNLHREGW